jgi:hypothetical protein
MMNILKTVGRIAAILAAALLVTWGLYSFIDSDFAANLPANRREMESDDGFFAGTTAEHDEAEHETAPFSGSLRPDGSLRPGRGHGEHHVGNSIDLAAAGEMVEPLLKVTVIVVLFVIGGRLFAGRRPKRPLPPHKPDTPTVGA